MLDVECGFRSQGIPVPHFFGTRNLPSFLEGRLQLGCVTEAGPDTPLVAALQQIHSTQAVLLRSPVSIGPLPQHEGDALVTNHPHTIILVRTADCVPVLLVDDQTNVVAAVHAGWRGAIAGIVSRTIDVCLTEFDAKRDRMRAAIGPSIGPCCYEVDEPVIDPVRSRYPQWGDVLQETVPGKARLDLKGLIHHQMVEAGLLPDHIGQIDLCTHCRADLFFSYRREGEVKGTMVSGIMLPATGQESGERTKPYRMEWT